MIITPRPYQEEALEALNYHVSHEDTNPCVVIPTGGGKSLLMAWSIQQWKLAYPPFRVCILAHRKELVRQNAEEMLALWPKADVGCYAAGLGMRDMENSIIFASIDSIYKRWGEFSKFDALIVDEAHRIPMSGEGKYREFIEGCRFVNKNLRVIGYTATPFRMGSGPICHRDHILNEICYEANVGVLISQGYLCRLRSKVGDVQVDLEDVKKNANGDYIVKSLAQAVDQTCIVSQAVRSVMMHVTAEKRKSIVLFCVDVHHCNQVSLELRKYGVYAPAITNKTPPKERERVANLFIEGKIHAICNVNVYTEGFNAKRVDTIVLFRPTLSRGLYEQMVGRGLRPHESKSDCLVLDYAQCIYEHGPIDCIGTGRTKMAECAECGDAFSAAVKVCPNCQWEIPKKTIERMESEEAERRMHEAEASRESILATSPQKFDVDGVFVHRHHKKGKPDSIRVQYRCGLKVYNEWICLDHHGTAQSKARKWWIRRFGVCDSRFMTVDHVLGDMLLGDRIQRVTKSITVVRRGKYTEITDCELNKEK